MSLPTQDGRRRGRWGQPKGQGLLLEGSRADHRLGWAYQWICQLGFDRDSWTAPVDAPDCTRWTTPTTPPPAGSARCFGGRVIAATSINPSPTMLGTNRFDPDCMDALGGHLLSGQTGAC